MMKRKIIVRTLLAGAALLAGTAAMAQDPPQAGTTAGQAPEQSEIEQLKAQVRALEEWKAQTIAAQAEAQTQAATTPPAGATVGHGGALGGAGSKIGVELYGSVQLDGIYDFGRIDPTWAGAFRPSKIPTTDGTFGDNGQALFSARQSLFGISGSGDVAGKPAKLAFEFDLFGQGSNAGETTFHLQRASLEWGPLLVGYDKTLFMDGDLFPNIIDYWGPSGMIYVKNAGLRYSLINNDKYYLGASLELPGNDVDPGNIRILDPGLAASLTSSQKLPDLIVAGKVGGDWGYVRLAGVARRVGFETLGTPDGAPNGGEFGWGLNLTATLKPAKTTAIKVGGVMGRGIASYFNDGGTDLAPVLQDNLAVEASAAKIYGVMLYVDQEWSDKFTSSLGASRTRLSNTNLQTGDAFHIGDYASGNLLYKPAENFLIGGEVLYGRREDNNGNSGSDLRVQLSLRYSYSIKLLTAK
jgi:hypothetical protein